MNEADLIDRKAAIYGAAQIQGAELLNSAPTFKHNIGKTLKPLDSYATRIQSAFRVHHKRTDSPPMLGYNYKLLDVPSLKVSKSGQLMFAGKPLEITNGRIGKGAYGSVFMGWYDGKAVAVKVGVLGEMKHLEKLLQIQAVANRRSDPSGPVRMVVPTPVTLEESVSGRSRRGIAIMPLMRTNLEAYMENMRCEPRGRRSIDELRNEKELLGRALNQFGLINSDFSDENILLDKNRQLYVTDLACITINEEKAERAMPILAQKRAMASMNKLKIDKTGISKSVHPLTGQRSLSSGHTIEEVLPKTHPFVEADASSGGDALKGRSRAEAMGRTFPMMGPQYGLTGGAGFSFHAP